MHQSYVNPAPVSTVWFRKTLFAVMTLLGLCSVVWAQDQFVFPIEGERARVSFMKGEVTRRSDPAAEWTFLTLEDFVQAGERVKTMKGARLELQLPDRSVIRFEEESDVRLIKAGYQPAQGKRDVQFSLLLGKTWANVQQAFGRNDGLQVETNNAVVGVRGTVFRMNVAPDKSVMVRVYSGRVTVSKPYRVAGPVEVGTKVREIPGPERVAGPRRVTEEEWIRIVEAMQQITVDAQGIPSKPRDFTMEEDLNDWVQWNLERDRQLR